MKKLLPFACAAVSCIFANGAAHAVGLRELCPDRPGLSTPACTVDEGHLQLEVGLGDWTLDRQSGTRTDTFIAADILARYGLTDHTEARIGWTAFGHERERSGDTVDRASRTGDVMLGIKQNLHNPDGSGFAIAAEPFVTLPVGRSPIGAGDWGAGLLVPVTYMLTDDLQFDFTPEIDARPDEDGSGRHLAYSSAVGLSRQIGTSVVFTAEYLIERDRDPAGHETQQLSGLSLAWLPSKQSQFDIGSNIGLNHNAPDVELYFGVTRRF